MVTSSQWSASAEGISSAAAITIAVSSPIRSSGARNESTGSSAATSGLSSNPTGDVLGSASAAAVSG